MDSVTPPSNTANSASEVRHIALSEIFKIFFIAGAISFGGGVVAYLREYLVRGSKWLSDEEFMSALEISETLPGLNSVNIAVIAGDDLRGVPGAAVAVAGLMLPGAVVVMTFGVLWSQSGHNPLVSHFLLGIAAAAVGLLLVVSLQLGKQQLTKLPDALIVVATFIGVSLLKLALWKVLLVLGTLAIWLNRPHPAKSESTHPFSRRAGHTNYRR